MVDVSPKLDSVLGKHLLLLILGKMLEYHDSIRIDLPHMVRIVLEDIHTRLVILAPCRDIGFVGLCARILLSEALGEVEAETIDIVLLEKILKAPLHMLLYNLIPVIEVMAHIVRMLCDSIVERVVVRCAVGCRIPPHLGPWVRTVCMIIHYVHDDCQASLVALVNELLVLLAGTIVLVEGEIVVRVVAPAEVTVKLLDRHKLHSIDTKLVDIVQLLESSRNVLRLCEIPQKHLINDKVIPVLNLIVRYLPCIFIPVDAEGRNMALSSLRERRSARYVLVIPLIVYYFGVWVADVCIRAGSVAQAILEAVFLRRVEIAESNPPAIL